MQQKVFTLFNSVRCVFFCYVPRDPPHMAHQRRRIIYEKVNNECARIRSKWLTPSCRTATWIVFSVFSFQCCVLLIFDMVCDSVHLLCWFNKVASLIGNDQRILCRSLSAINQTCCSENWIFAPFRSLLNMTTNMCRLRCWRTREFSIINLWTDDDDESIWQ